MPLFSSHTRLTILSFLLLLPFILPAARAGDNASSRERFVGLVESMNTTSAQRDEVIANIYNELRGPQAGLMHSALISGISRGNLLVQLGAVEAMAMRADPHDIETMALVLESTPRLEVKTELIRLLPVFQLYANERTRLAFIRYVNAAPSVGDWPELLPLRRIPLNRQGRLDKQQITIRQRLVEIICKQFDPVSQAILRINDPVYGDTARTAVGRFTAGLLGNDSRSWSENWRSLSDYIPLDNASEIQEIRLTALTSLVDMGAAPGSVLLNGFEYLVTSGDPIIIQAVMEGAASILRVAFSNLRQLAGDNSGMAEGRAEGEWLDSLAATTANLTLFTLRQGKSLLASPVPSVRLAAVIAMGAGSSFPRMVQAAAPDLERERDLIINNLADLAMHPETTQELRLRLVAAMGEVLEPRTVGLLKNILASPYSEADRSGQEVAEAAVAALAELAISQTDNPTTELARHDAREAILTLLSDMRQYPSNKAGVPPVRIAHLALWRLERLAKSRDISLEQDFWRQRLGWQ
ncbi:MAG: hypothetical protein LBU79_06860 [Planctomycetota bacterium]|jgi:hypothetical protein|nr:hypothetical protein [Planctomycetota bacterium]